MEVKFKVWHKHRGQGKHVGKGTAVRWIQKITFWPTYKLICGAVIQNISNETCIPLVKHDGAVLHQFREVSIDGRMDGAKHKVSLGGKVVEECKRFDKQNLNMQSELKFNSFD